MNLRSEPGATPSFRPIWKQIGQGLQPLLDRIIKQGIAVDSTAFEEAFLSYIGKRLQRVSAPCATVMINIAKTRSSLEGDTSADRARSFAYQLLDHEFREQWATVFPVLDRRLAQVAVNSMKALSKLVEAICDNWGEVVRHFELDGEITAIEFGLGDPHAGGCTVCSIASQSKSVIYKPRGVKIDVAFQELYRGARLRTDVPIF